MLEVVITTQISHTMDDLQGALPMLKLFSHLWPRRIFRDIIIFSNRTFVN